MSKVVSPFESGAVVEVSNVAGKSLGKLGVYSECLEELPQQITIDGSVLLPLTDAVEIHNHRVGGEKSRVVKDLEIINHSSFCIDAIRSRFYQKEIGTQTSRIGVMGGLLNILLSNPDCRFSVHDLSKLLGKNTGTRIKGYEDRYADQKLLVVRRRGKLDASIGLSPFLRIVDRRKNANDATRIAANNLGS